VKRIPHKFIRRDSASNKKLIAELNYYLKGLYHKLDEDHMWILSASIAFNIIICTVPLILILFSILGIYLDKQESIIAINNYLDNISGITPDLKKKLQDIIFSATDEITSHRTTTAIIGITGILWTASGLFGTIRDVLNRIYKTRYTTFFLKDKLKDIFMVAVVVIIFSLSFASTILYELIQSAKELLPAGSLFNHNLLDFASKVFGFIFTFIMFYLIFKLVPYGKINNKIIIISSITSAVLNTALKYLFVLYLVTFANYQKVYGAYAAIIGLIFWIYYSSFTFVLGAETGQLYREKTLS
jgi:membrane protein